MSPLEFSQLLAVDFRRMSASIGSIEASLYLERKQIDKSNSLAVRAAEDTQGEAAQIAIWLMGQAETLDAPLPVGDEFEFLVRRTAARTALNMCACLLQGMTVRLLEIAHRLSDGDAQRDTIYALASSASFTLQEAITLSNASGLVTYGDRAFIDAVARAAESCTPGQGQPVAAILDQMVDATKGDRE